MAWPGNTKKPFRFPAIRELIAICYSGAAGACFDSSLFLFDFLARLAGGVAPCWVLSVFGALDFLLAFLYTNANKKFELAENGEISETAYRHCVALPIRSLTFFATFGRLGRLVSVSVAQATGTLANRRVC